MELKDSFVPLELWFCQKAVTKGHGQGYDDIVKREVKVISQQFMLKGRMNEDGVQERVGPWIQSHNTICLFIHLVRTILKNRSNCFHGLNENKVSFVLYPPLSLLWEV